MKLPILLAFFLGGNSILLPLIAVASAEIPRSRLPLRVAQQNRPFVPAEAGRWGIRLNGYQLDYYKKYGVFAKTADSKLKCNSRERQFENEVQSLRSGEKGGS
jgi:hypothetical protein